MKRLIDFFRKKRILEAAKELGCDVDGDLIRYKGINYYVDIQHEQVKRVRLRKKRNLNSQQERFL